MAGFFHENVCFIPIQAFVLWAIKVNITVVKQKLWLDHNKLPQQTIILFFGQLKYAYNMQLEDQKKLKPLLNSSV